MLVFPQMVQRTHMASSLEDLTREGPGLQNRDETTKLPGGKSSNMGHGGSNDL